MVLSSILIGAIVGVCAIGFFSIVGLVTSTWIPALPTNLNLSLDNYSYKIGISLFIAAVIAGQILKRLEGNRPNGPADIILAVNQENIPNLKDGFLTVLLALISLSGGASVGIFGPLVHFGGCLSAWLSHQLRHLNKSIILSIGAGSAVSAIFSIPIGAAIFSQEAVLRKFSKEGIFPILIGTFSSYALSLFILGNHRLFPIDTPFELSLQNIEICILLGVCCGVLVSLYMYLIPEMGRYAKVLKVPTELRPLIPALVLFILSPILPHLLGTGVSSISLALAGKLSISLLIILCLSKIVVTPLCLGFGFFGGVFGPALFIGAMLGAIMDIVFGQGGSLFLAVGAATMIASTIGAPFACVVIIFELTGNYNIALLSIISITISYQISNRQIGKSIFDYQLKQRGIELR